MYRIRIYGDSVENIRLEVDKVDLTGILPGLDSHCCVGVKDKWLVFFGGESLDGVFEGREETVSHTFVLSRLDIITAKIIFF